MKVKIFVVIVVLVSTSALATAAFKSPAQIAEAIDFIKSVQLYTHVPKSSVSIKESNNITDHQKQGFVDSGSLVSFTDKLTGQNKEDVLNSALFCQLAAEAIYNRETETDKWYEYYENTMEKLGWVMQNFTFQHYHPVSSDVSLDQLAIDILTAIATDQEEIVIAKEVLQALKNLKSDDNRIVLFEDHSYNNEAGNFQILPCSQDDSGQIVMAMSAFHFSAHKEVTRFLFFGWDANDIDIYTSSQSITLDMDVYSVLRETVVARLGDQAKKLINNIPLA